MRSLAPPPAPEITDRLLRIMPGIFLGGGLLASIEALLVPRLKLTLHASYGAAMLAQLAYYSGYLLFAMPATWLTARAGTLRAIAGALAVMAAGCVAFAAALVATRFAAMLLALLLISAGATVLQIACNGLMATHGPRAEAAARFTLLQALNSLGTVAGPVIAAWFLLGGDGDRLAAVPFLGLGLGFALLAAWVAAERDLLPVGGDAAPTLARLAGLLRSRPVAWGSAAIFAYVGAEVTIGTLAVNYLILPERTGLAPVAAGRLVALYWGGAMIGRFGGAWALRRVPAARLLGWASLAAALLALAAMLLHGPAGGVALLAIGLCNSIMFPTIYGLAMPTAPEDVPAASMLLCIAVIGGAIVPMLAGLIADRATLATALLLPAACYGGIRLFAGTMRAAAR